MDLPAAAWQRRLAWPALAAAVLLVLYSVSGRAPADQAQSLPSGPSEGAADRAASSLGASEAAPVGTSANPGKQHDIELPPAGVETPLALEIEVTRPCWLTLTVDGTRQVFRVVQPGERERQQGREFVIRAGDAGAIQLALDGEPARALGASGEVLTVRITRENYRSLLESPSASLF